MGGSGEYYFRSTGEIESVDCLTGAEQVDQFLVRRDGTYGQKRNRLSALSNLKAIGSTIAWDGFLHSHTTLSSQDQDSLPVEDRKKLGDVTYNLQMSFGPRWKDVTTAWKEAEPLRIANQQKK